MTELSNNIASFVHHVELTKAGWWSRACQRFVLAVLWEHDEPIPSEVVRSEMESRFHARIGDDEYARMLDDMASAGMLINLPGRGIKLTESTAQQLGREVTEAQKVENYAREVFLAHLSDAGVEGEDELWIDFVERLLQPMVAELGARTYEIIASRAISPDRFDFETFLSAYPQDLRPLLRTAIVNFFDPSDPNLRSYILRQLNSRLTIEASGLTSDVIQRISAAPAPKRPTIVFVDTNVLFSILELHSNPANEAAEALLQLIVRVKEHWNLKLYLLPTTVDEARARLGAEIDRLRTLIISPKVAAAASNAELSGLAQRFVQEASRGTTRIRAEDFFGPYRENLIAYARARGLELYNEDVDRYRSSQPVIDDTLTRWEFEKQRYADRAKSYEQVLHDVTLWHVARAKRPARFDSPKDAGAWVVTVDWRFLGFDRTKSRASRTDIPVCVHPTVLTQLLQFWVPRGEEVERAIIASLRVPLLLQEFDAEAERVTVKILDTLGRFQNSDAVSTQTLIGVLTNDALRRNMIGPTTVEHQIQLVESAILDENARLQQRAERELQKRKDSDERFKQQSTELRERDNRIVELTDRMSRAEMEYGARIAALESSNRDYKELQGAKKASRAFWLWRVIVPTVLTAILGVVAAILLRRGGVADSNEIATAGCLGMGLVIAWFADASGKNTTVAETSTYRWLHKSRLWVFGIVGAIIITIVADIVSAQVQDWFMQVR